MGFFNVFSGFDTDSLSEELPAEKEKLSEEAMLRGLRDVFREYLAKEPKISKEIGAQLEGISELKQLVDLVAANTPFPWEDTQELLEESRFPEIATHVDDSLLREALGF